MFNEDKREGEKERDCSSVLCLLNKGRGTKRHRASTYLRAERGGGGGLDDPQAIVRVLNGENGNYYGYEHEPGDNE